MRSLARSGTAPLIVLVPVPVLALATLLASGGCGSSHGPADGTDAGVRSDGAARRDAGGARDAGSPPVDAGRPDHWSACEDNSECTVAPASCCGTCGAATPGDMVGVNRSRLGEQSAEACADGEACPLCAGMQSPYLVATCTAGTCEAIDLRSDPATECTDSSDCFLWVAECIDCGEIPDANVIAVSSTARVSDLLCDEGVVPPPCAPAIPDHLAAICTAGRCEVHDTTSGG